MTRTAVPPSLALTDVLPPLMPLQDEPGEVVCRAVLARPGSELELGVAVDHQPRTVYLVAVQHCMHLSPGEARAAADQLLRAADEAEARSA